MKSIIEKKWISSTFNVIIVVTLVILQDSIAAIPHIEKFILVFLILYAAYQIHQRLKTNNRYSANDFIRLQHENDNHYKIANVLFGILSIAVGVFFYYTQHFDLIGSINFLLFGFTLLFLGITHRHSVILASKNNQEIEALSTDFSIHSADKAIEFRKGQITLTQKDDTSKHLKNLDLDFDTVIAIKGWLAAKLEHSELKYYRATEGTREEL